jgi:dipeptidyl-peptidase-3
MWDQNYKHNLRIRKALEHIYVNYKGDRKSADWKKFTVYLKRVWFSNGIHHHYSSDKIKPEFSRDYFNLLLKATKTKLDSNFADILFNDADAKKVNLDESKGLLAGSAVNFYDKGITVQEVEDFYKNMKSPDPPNPIPTGSTQNSFAMPMASLRKSLEKRRNVRRCNRQNHLLARKSQRRSRE